jgi:hypothetical protein
MVGAMARTEAWAWVIEHGWADEHAVPDPVGEAYRVVMTAAVAGAEPTARPPTTSTAAAAALVSVISRFSAGGDDGWGPPGTTVCS